MSGHVSHRLHAALSVMTAGSCDLSSVTSALQRQLCGTTGGLKWRVSETHYVHVAASYERVNADF